MKNYRRNIKRHGIKIDKIPKNKKEYRRKKLKEEIISFGIMFLLSFLGDIICILSSCKIIEGYIDSFFYLFPFTFCMILFGYLTYEAVKDYKNI